MISKFELDEKQQKQIQDWLKNTVYPAVVAKQRESFKNPPAWTRACWDEGYPEEGAIGGGVVYRFIPTSVGVIAKVEYDTNGLQKFELDVTDYDTW